METESVYCSTCKRPVRLTWTPMASHDGEAPLRDPELVCLEYGECCTGATCSVSEMPRAVMGVRLARSGLKAGPWRTLRAPCAGCEQEQYLELVDDSFAFCPVCGTTNPVSQATQRGGGFHPPRR